MNRIILVAAAIAMASAAGALAEPPAAADLLAGAIEFSGGRAVLADLPDLEMRGTYEGTGRLAGRRSDMVRRDRADGAYRSEVTMDFRGRKITVVEFFDGTVRKRRARSSWDDLPLIEAEEERDHRVTFLVDLDPAGARVEDGGVEADVDVWRVTVQDGGGDAALYMAKGDGRLVALEYPGTSAEGMGTKKDVRRKVVFRDYRPVGDLVLPFDVETIEDGSPAGRVRFETIVKLEAFDPAWLRIPDPTQRFIPSEELAF